MTALCGGGSSGAKPGYTAVVTVGSGYIALMMENAGVPWLIPLIPLMTLPDIALSAFCGSDPPAMVAPTAAEADALLGLDIGNPAFASGLAKMPAILANLMWIEFCQCNSGTLTPPTYPAQPAGSVVVVPIPRGNVQPCMNITWGMPAGSYSLPQPDFTRDVSLPSGSASAALMTVKTTQISGTFSNVAYAVTPYDANGNYLASTGTSFTVTDQNPHTFVVPLPPNTAKLRLDVNPLGSSGSQSWGASAAIYCNGDVPNSPQQPCCPPDTATSAQLDTIIGLLTVIQRNYAPFAYIPGTAVVGLTGSGSFGLSRAIGLRVQITSYPSSLGSAPGNPDYIFDLGWISVSEADGMIQEQRISRTAFTWFPQLAPIATSVNYFLNPGVTATITPLLPEA